MYQKPAASTGPGVPTCHQCSSLLVFVVKSKRRCCGVDFVAFLAALEIDG